MTVTKANAKEHCRTCLVRIVQNQNAYAEECKGVGIEITSNLELQTLLTKIMYVAEVEEGDPQLDAIEYPPRMCCDCFNLLREFDTFRKQAKESVQKLQQIFSGDNGHVSTTELTTARKLEDDESHSNNDDIYKLIFKNNSLMETESVMLEESATSMANAEACREDPFEAAEAGNESAMEFKNGLGGAGADSSDDADRQEQDTASDDEQEAPQPQQRRNNKKQLTAGESSQDAVLKPPKAKPQRHIKRQKNSHKCAQCGRRFAHRITLDAHVRKVHEGSKKPFQCDRCDKAYSFIGGLYTHIREIHDVTERSYTCDHPGCDRLYTSFVSMQKHKRTKHSDCPPQKKYVCEICGATFNQTGNLKYHNRTKHPTAANQALPEQRKERHQCTMCEKTFHSRYTLKYHTLQLHTHETKYECPVCGRRMAKKFMLVQHMLVHSSEKTPCEQCGKQFVRKFELEAHIKAVHMKLKPFDCQYCNESFASRKTLRHHEFIHTGEKPYVCDICGLAYRQQTVLKKHKKSHEILLPPSSSTSTQPLISL